METLFIILTTGSMCICSFFLGAKLCQSAKKGKDIRLPYVKELGLAFGHTEKKQFKKSQDTLNTILENIEAYDGTSKGQKDVKGR